MLQAVKDGQLITWPGFDGRRYQQTFETDAVHGHGPYEPAATEYKIKLEGTH
jgi:hypothetical protein